MNLPLPTGALPPSPDEYLDSASDIASDIASDLDGCDGAAEGEGAEESAARGRPSGGPLSDEQLITVLIMAPDHTGDDIAGVLDMHRSTLARRLQRYHHFDLVQLRASRVIALDASGAARLDELLRRMETDHPQEAKDAAAIARAHLNRRRFAPTLA